ncbi:MAG: TatD family hydrolase [Prevotella sp.]|nr:TatD family hydrolase [Prevotella sp.]
MIIDTHAHLDGEEFKDDLPEVIQRAQEAGVGKVFLPAIDLKTTEAVLTLSRQYPGYAYPMIGLHPEEVRADWREQLQKIHDIFLSDNPSSTNLHPSSFIAIGEVGLDYYWSREFEQEQLEAFEEQVRWSIETRLPLMIHCRKAQNEMVKLLRRYEQDLPGGVFHCFTGNEHEAEELLSFDRFVLGIGGVLTFKKSHLPEVLPAVVPLDRIVLETDSPYMAPVPHRGQRNESAYVACVLSKLAESYGVSEEVVAEQTNRNVERVFGLE